MILATNWIPNQTNIEHIVKKGVAYIAIAPVAYLAKFLLSSFF